MSLRRRTGGRSGGTRGTGQTIGNTMSRFGSGGSGGRGDSDEVAAGDSIVGEEGKLRGGD